jgi:hypothetical protein
MPGQGLSGGGRRIHCLRGTWTGRTLNTLLEAYFVLPGWVERAYME